MMPSFPAGGQLSRGESRAVVLAGDCCRTLARARPKNINLNGFFVAVHCIPIDIRSDSERETI